MNYTQLITEVQKVALKQHNVNSFSSNDVYDEWNKPHTQYASVNIGLESADRTENTIIYNCVLYYGDRLLQNASNKIAIQDDAVKVLQGIISNLPDEITYYTPINYTVFEQEFADYIAGAYCRVRLETEFDQGNCSLDDYIEELKTLYITENGIFSVAGYDQVEVHVEGGTVEGITEEECREIVEGYNYATKDEIPDLTPYAKTVDVNTGLASKQPIGDYALRSELPDLAPYATKDEIPSLDGYATEQWVNNQGFIKSGDIPELTGYAKIVDVDASLAKKQDNISDLDVIRSGAALGATAIQEHQSLDGYATESWVNEQGFLTEHQDLSEYAKKDEIPSLDGYATESWVNEQNFLTEHQPLKTINGESIIGEGDIEISVSGDYYEKIPSVAMIQNYKKTGDKGPSNAYIDVSSYGGSKSRLSNNSLYIYDADGNVIAKLGDSVISTMKYGPGEESTFFCNVGHGETHFSYEFNDGTQNLIRVSPYAGGIAYVHFDADGHSTSDVVATENWVNEQGFLKEHQDLSEYALKTEIPSLDGYATEQWVNDQNFLTEHQSLKTINNLSIIGTGNIEISGGGAANIVSLTQAEYDDLIDKDPNTLYNIIDGSPVATEEWVENKHYTTMSSVENKGYLTSTIFQYNAETNTLNITI